MELKVLDKHLYKIAAIANRGNCDVEDALHDSSDQSTYSAQVRLVEMIKDICNMGLTAEHIYLKCLNSKYKIYELKAGKIRLFLFKGDGNLLLICTVLLRKTSAKANRQEIKNAIELKKNFDQAIITNNIIYI